MDPSMHSSFSVEPARPEEMATAFQLIFQESSTDHLELRVANALELIEKGELNAEGVLVARHHQQVLGAMVCMTIPGSSGLVWPPQARSGATQMAVEDALVRRASHWLRQRGAKLGQALLTSADAHLGASLQRNGFTHITRLWYLSRSPELTADLLLASERLEFQTYRGDDSALFLETMWRTYEDTRDCPEVNGVRTPDEVLEGHQAQGKFDPERWWLARYRRRPVGVLLMTDMPEWDSWDVSYVGVVPEARQRGFGRELMRKALLETRAADIQQLTLSVDGRNQPAWNLYQQLGFEAFDQREVFLAIWC
jgi:ribosomal protein S18 acetylase RimI-like enzyme